jgi:extracellular elastinolytic metalloproteinase
MGEGWSDAMAEYVYSSLHISCLTHRLCCRWTEQKSATVTDYVMGQYVINSAAGIRTHPYSTSASVNPLRYSSLQTLNEVHDIGEIWANILHNVYAALVNARGFSSTARTNSSGTQGNVVFLRLFLDALALQPCNPTCTSVGYLLRLKRSMLIFFVVLTARSAWIQADANRYNGANKCTLWRAFASRGLGVNAANRRDDTTIPSDC